MIHPSDAQPFDLHLDRVRRNEIRHHLGVARAQGVYAYPDPDARTIVLRGPAGFFPPDRFQSADLCVSLEWLMAHDGEVHDYLISLLSILKAVRTENEDEANGAPSLPSPGESSTEGAPVSAPATTPAVTPARAPSICYPCGKPYDPSRGKACGCDPDSAFPTPPRPWPRPGLPAVIPCPACDDLSPCDDHRVEQVPPPLPGWMLGVIGGLLFVLTVAVVAALLKDGAP